MAGSGICFSSVVIARLPFGGFGLPTDVCRFAGCRLVRQSAVYVLRGVRYLLEKQMTVWMREDKNGAAVRRLTGDGAGRSRQEVAGLFYLPYKL